MAIPYIPPTDAAFDAWLLNFDTLITANPANYGLVAGDAVIIGAAADPWYISYPIAINPATRTSATIATKDGDRAAAEAVVRPYAIRIRNNGAVSDALKIGVGVTVPNVPPTPIPAPVDAPEINLVSAIPLVQRLSYKAVGFLGKNKPFGVTGVEIWRSVGVAPAVDPTLAQFQGIVTKSPFQQSFISAQQGDIVTYFARFITRSGPGGVAQVGPWSVPTSMVIM